MPADRRHRRPAALAVLVLGLGPPLLAAGWPSPGRAATAVTFSVVNGTVNAGADRFEAGSDAFPNFRNGAFNNYYPMAHAHVDGSPSSGATASPADTGPIGQAVASGTFGTPPFQQAQYVNALYPPGTTKPQTLGTPGGLYATATAGPTSASAQAEFASTAPPAAAAQTPPLQALLLAWRLRWLTAADAARYPMRAAASTPDGVTAGTAQTTASIDPSDGLVLGGSAHANSASFGGGVVHLGNVDVAVTSTNNGSPAHTISVHIGSASVGGVPVTIDQNGVSVDGQAVPGLGMATGQANTELNQALAQAGYHVTTTAPRVVKSSNQETIDASGVEVQFTQPNVAAGVPNQQAVHQIGEVFVDSLAAPGVPLAPGAPTATPGTAAVTPSGGGVASQPFVPGTPGTTGGGTPAETTPSEGAASPAPAPSRPLLVSLKRAKPIDLVLLYFLWQSIVVGAVASLWWRRNGLRQAAT